MAQTEYFIPLNNDSFSKCWNRRNNCILGSHPINAENAIKYHHSMEDTQIFREPTNIVR